MPAQGKSIEYRVKSGVIFVFFLFSILSSLLSAPVAQAACYCQDPSVCKCSTTAPESAKQNPGSIGGVAVYCDTSEEANSDDAVRAPICGSSPEVISKCAKGADGNPGFLVCWGSSVAVGITTLSPLPGPKQSQTYTPSVPFKFNGKDYGIVGQNFVTVCSDNLICCGYRSNCFEGDIPQTPSSCPDQNPSVTPPVDICGITGGGPSTPPNFVGQSKTDARIYFPHVKNTSAITYLLQSMFRPISWTVEQIKQNVVYSRLFEHQGINDATPVINKVDNNASLIPNRPAPTPVFDFTHPPPGVPADGACVISNVRTNPGDDLLGKKIFADMEYTQKFEYDLLPITTGCLEAGRHVDPGNQGDCCGGATCRSDPYTGEILGCRCNHKWINLPTKGKNLVYTKSPFLEYLYQNLVVGPAAIYRRFVAQDTAKEIEDIPTKATYLATATEIARGPSNLRQTPTDIYFPHLGSVYDYFLKNLQKLLRPKDTSDTTQIIPGLPPGVSPPPTITDVNCKICNASGLPTGLIAILEAAGQAYNVPGSLVLSFLYNEGGLNQPWTDANIWQRWSLCDTKVSPSGARGPFQILDATWPGHQDDVKKDYPNFEAQFGRPPDRCYLLESAYAAAQLIYTGHYGNPAGYPYTTCFGVDLNTGTPSDPSKSSCNWTQGDVMTASRQYLGYCAEAGKSSPYPAGTYNKDVLGNFSSWACTGNPGPIVPPGPPPPAANDFVVSGTPTQICQSVGYGVRQQQGTFNCIECANSKFIRSIVCPGPAQNTNLCLGKADNTRFNFPNPPTIPDPDYPAWETNLCAQCRNDHVLRLESCNTIATVDLCRGQTTGLYESPTNLLCCRNNSTVSNLCSCQTNGLYVVNNTFNLCCESGVSSPSCVGQSPQSISVSKLTPP